MFMVVSDKKYTTGRCHPCICFRSHKIGYLNVIQLNFGLRGIK